MPQTAEPCYRSGMRSFWQSLPKPFFVLAPLEDVTDAAFRRLISTKGKPDVMWTEFTSADGLVLAPEKGRLTLLKKLMYTEGERPIVAQLFSSSPERMEKSSALCQELGFDGVDINMGCPDRSVEKSGCGAAMIKTPELAREIIKSVRRGAPNIPVSVKTRIGYNVVEIETWIPNILAEKPAALTVHLRTRKEMSEVPAHWELMPRIVALRDTLSPETLIIGNGDAKNIADAREKAEISGCDGVMLGRAIFGNPWLFKNKDVLTRGALDTELPSQTAYSYLPSREERIQALIEHIMLFKELLEGTVHFAVMKKHFKAYISGWDNAKDLRVSLMEAATLDDALLILRSSL